MNWKVTLVHGPNDCVEVEISGPREAVLAWARAQCEAKHPEHNTVLAHSFHIKTADDEQFGTDYHWLSFTEKL